MIDKKEFPSVTSNYHDPPCRPHIACERAVYRVELGPATG